MNFRYEVQFHKEILTPIEFGHQRNKWNEKEFVKITTTNIENDIGQTTVPWIDMQKVEPVPHTPLSGAGLYHKALKDENAGSGYLGIMLFTKDISK